mgnify:CR=1 FL=1
MWELDIIEAATTSTSCPSGTTASSVARRTTPGPGRPRLVEPKRRGETAREEILDAAEQVFCERGFDAATMDDVRAF